MKPQKLSSSSLLLPCAAVASFLLLEGSKKASPSTVASLAAWSPPQRGGQSRDSIGTLHLGTSSSRILLCRAFPGTLGASGVREKCGDTVSSLAPFHREMGRGQHHLP